MPESIVVESTVYRCGHDRKLKSVKLVSGPPHVMRFIGGDSDSDFYGSSAFELFTELSEKGYEFTTRTVYQDVSIVEFIDIQGD